MPGIAACHRRHDMHGNARRNRVTFDFIRRKVYRELAVLG